MLAVENSRNDRCGRMTLFWSSRVMLALDLEHALDHEHHVGPAGVVLVEHQRHRVLQRPGQHALAVLGDLLAVAQHDRVLADQVDARDVAVEVDPHARPVEMGRDLLDVGRLAGAVIALDHHPAVVGEAGQDRERGVAIEPVGLVDLGHVLGRLGEGRHLKVGIDAEALPHRDLDVGRGGQVVQADQPLRLGHRKSRCTAVHSREVGSSAQLKRSLSIR